jgi:L-ribulose-5-phosphate 4-epimerase
MNFQDIRKQVYNTTMEAVEAGLIYLSAGNISARVDEDKIAITPGGIKYSKLRPEDIAIVSLDGEFIDGPHKPSSETPMHTHIMKNMPDINAVCHTHSEYAITFAMLGEEIPRANLELFVCGAPIPVTPWACPGTLNGGLEALKFFKERPELKAVILRSHGLIAIGGNLSNAFDIAYDAEVGLKTYHNCLQIGKPIILTQKEIDEIHEAYA